MKGTVDKLLNFMKLTEDEEYDEEYEEYEDEEEEEPEKVGFSFFKKKEKEPVEESEEEVSQPFDHVLSREEKKKRFTSTGSKVVSMNGRGVEVYVIKPQDFAEAQTAADLLKKGRTVVINLEGVELTVAQRSTDFLVSAVQLTILIIHLSTKSIDRSVQIVNFALVVNSHFSEVTVS